MAVRPNILSICTGGGGLDLGVRLAVPGARTVCYVEREAFAVANLVAAIQDGFLDEAPLWSDLTTFDGTAWRGTVDWLIGGIPCQPHSAAGQRRGADDERDLWPVTARIIGEVRPGIVFLENVPGIARYHHERIGPDLRAMGYRTEEGLFSAAEVGAPHVRQRFFVLAYSDGPRRERPGARTEQRQAEQGACVGKGRTELAHADHSTGGTERELEKQGRRPQEHGRGEPEPLADGNIVNGGGQIREGPRQLETGRSSQTMADCDRKHGVLCQRGAGSESHRSRKGLAVSNGCGRGASEQRIQARQSDATGRGISAMAHAEGVGRREVRRPTERQLAGAGAPLPDAERECAEGVHINERQGQGIGLQSVFPPGPEDLEAWARVLAEVPALEPAFCNVADGLATTGDRSHRLRLLGNGVVPLVAAHALRTLAARAQIDAHWR